MSDRYQDFVSTSVGKFLVKNLGLPNPMKLERWTAGQELVAGTVAIGGTGRLVESLPGLLDELTVANTTDTTGDERFKGLVFDATGLTRPEQLVALQEFFTPLMRRLQACPRVVVLGTPPASLSGEERITQRSLEGFTRSLGKEIGRGGTVQLVYVSEGFEDSVSSTLAFLLSAKSAYVSAQVVTIGADNAQHASALAEWETPLAGKVALVTGASRGIGEKIAEVLHRDGALVIGVDVPQAANELTAVMERIGGEVLLLDITAPDAPHRIAAHVRNKHGQLDVLVHNAGITRDKKLANMSTEKWTQVIDVNLRAPEAISTHLIAENVLADNGRIIDVSSTSGIAGNTGQTNYAASKAGVIGMVDALAPTLERGITVNAVAPGFIITAMTAAVPFATREVGQRLNAMSQGGLPVDVAETIAWFANPASTGVNGNVVRVCGQMLLGA